MHTAHIHRGGRRNAAALGFFVLSTVATMATTIAATLAATTAAIIATALIGLVAATSPVHAASGSDDGAMRLTSPFPSLPADSRGEAVIENSAAQVAAQLLVSRESPARIGVLFDLAPGWHLYWRNPGETGIAPQLEFDTPNYQVGPVNWPAPITFREADGLFTTYGYEKQVLLFAPLEITAATEASSGNARETARVEASVLVCNTQCVPATFSLSTPMQPNLSASEEMALDALFAGAEKQIPADATLLGWNTSAHWVGGNPLLDEVGQVSVTIDACATESAGDACPRITFDGGAAAFLPFEGETFEFDLASAVTADRAGAEGAAISSGSTLSLSLAIQLTRLEEGDARLQGLIPIQDETGRKLHIQVDLPIQAAGNANAVPIASAPAPPIAVSAGQWLRIFLLALLGGLILNGMPCVLPVLAIKVVAVADMAEKDPREVRLHGLAYTGGVLGSMAVLAGIVLSLRAAGHAVGWGFQFQEPLFVAAISALLVGFALNLFGVFEIEMGQGRLASVGQDSSGVQRSAFEGLLAVILATPCTAPFLGTAVGFAFATSGYGIVAIFLAIGLGLAAPFLIVSFFPALARFIPRSGPWMLTLRAGLGFSLLATVVWLLWVLGQSGGADAVVAMIGALLLFSFLLWGFGQLQPLRSVWLGRASVVAIICLAFTSFNLIDFDPATNADRGTAAGNSSADLEEGGWATYSEAAVAEALAAGRPAFVVFTADWCITCKMNEKAVLKRDSVRDAFAAGGYALFKADWTRRDDTIRKRLADFGRAGVPLYLVYSPDAPGSPEVLSELLSQREVIDALEGPQFAARP